MQVLVAHGDLGTRARFTEALQDAGFDVMEAADSMDVMRKVFVGRPTAVVTDLKLPGMDGLEMVRVLRAATDVPILALAPMGAGQHAAARVLDAGADDYMDKPVHASEFVARVRAAVRRHQREVEAASDGRVLQTGALVIDCDAETVTKHGEPVRLTRTEYRLLAALATHIGRVAPHRYLLSTVWGEEYVGDSHYLRVYMGYLRNKLEDNPSQPRYILNEWGTGYRLAALAPAVAETPETGLQTATVA